jgi:hypothetical protein
MDQNLIIGVVVIVALGLLVWKYLPAIKSLIASTTGIEMFEGTALPSVKKNKTNAMRTPAANHSVGGTDASILGSGDAAAAHVVRATAPAATAEGFADFASINSEMGSVPMAAAHKPQGCYPREHINPVDLLPNDANSQWAQVNPQGAGDIQGKNFLSAGSLIGINTIGQSMRNANLQLRAEPPCPQVNVSPWNISTIEPDLVRKPLE